NAEVGLAADGLVLPAGVAVVVPELCRAGFEGHAVECDTEPRVAGGHGCRRHLWFHRHAKREIHFRNRVRIVPVWEMAGLMIRYAVRPDKPVFALNGNRHAIRRAFSTR